MKKRRLKNPKATLSGIIIFLFMMLPILQCSCVFTHSAYLIIDGSIEYQTIDGWGITHFITWDWEGPKRYPIPEQDVMYQIKNDLGIDYVQIYDHTFNIFMEEANDDNDPFHFNWDSYNTQFNSHSIMFERMREMQDAGLKFALALFKMPPWLCDASGHFDSRIPNVYDELGEYWAAFCIYARNNYGLNIPYIIIQTEPSVGRCTWTPKQYRDAIKAVGARVRQKGFTTMIIAPDDAAADYTENMCQTILPDPVAKRYMNCIAYHPYDGFSGRDGPDKAISAMTALANDKIVKDSSLPLWQTEWTLAWAYGDRMRDWVDTLRLALDSAKMIYNCHVYGNSSLFTLWSGIYDWGYDVDGNGRIEREGIFGPGVIGGKLKLKKYGHVMSQYTRYIPPGSKRIHVALSGSSKVFVTGYKDPNTGTFTLEFINKEPRKVDLNVTVKNISGLTNLKVIRTSAREDSAEVGTISLSAGSFTFSLPESSFTTLTGHSTVSQ